MRLLGWACCAGACVLGCTDGADHVAQSLEPELPAEQVEQGAPVMEPELAAAAPDEGSALVLISEASFVPGPSPEPPSLPEASALPAIVELTAPPGVTNGGTVQLRVTLEPPQAAALFLVQVAGDSGYHTVRGTDADGDGRYEIEVAVRADVQATSLVIAVAPTDELGNVGAYREVTLRVVPSGVGDVKVTLSFPPNHDLDLHVFEPSGFEVSYLAPSSPSGGRLDLDSGANCVVGVASSENIFWPPSAAPVGQYRVVVHEFEQCEPGVIDFTVRVENAGLVQTFHGSFADGAEGTAVEVTAFSH